MPKANEAERDIIRHSLGLGRKGKPYRNHFATHDNTSDFPTVSSLVSKGFMTQGRLIPPGDNNYRYYHVTDAGMRAVGVDPRHIDQELRMKEEE